MINEKKLVKEIWSIFNETYNNSLKFNKAETKLAERILIDVQKIIEKQPKVDKWIPCSERLPEEHDSIFAKFKGTDKWSNAMFEKTSNEVNVTIEFEDGKRAVKTLHTIDGRWNEGNRGLKFKVIAWQPLPEAWKGEIK